ncbi:MAG: efflux RND transporter permease subunit [Desulfovibrionaceae bacterium]|nr:efflux RND transporter permease subunit [Desulfovibrionaceae bacterium]
MARFFIDRPIFAWVIAIIIMLAGSISVLKLPVAQFPDIAPPTISITTRYIGASAQTAQDTVTQVIEQNMNGLDYLQYMSSSSNSDGSIEILLTFDKAADANIAQVQVQNKLQLAMALMPDAVQRQGITVEKKVTNYLVSYSFYSEDGSMNASDISDYVSSYLIDSLRRVSGVGEVQLWGSQYGMRIWLNPQKLLSYKLVPSDVINAIKAFNAQISAGQLGALPHSADQQINMSVAVQERLSTPDEFERIVIRTNADGSLVRVRDVARVELGQELYSSYGRFNTRPSGNIGIKLTTGANALDTKKNVEKFLEENSRFFPKGLKYAVPYDTTPFVEISIHEVFKTLVEAIVLVFIVMFIFLQNFRATLIPTIAVPVVLLGTFAVLAAFGYSINTLTMFGVVLAIGLLVDDAIVVVENVERLMEEEDLSPREATRKSMDQISGALVGIAMVLAAVFLPMAFFGGSVGVIYRQFSITIVASMALSVLVALILTPALCASMLKPRSAQSAQTQRGFWGWFNRSFERMTSGYLGLVRSCIRRPVRIMLIYVLLVGGMALLFRIMPSGFLPDEDQGMFMVQTQLPPGSTMEDTEDIMNKVEKYCLEDEKEAVDKILVILGSSFAGTGQNSAMAFVRLKDWKERNRDDLRVSAVTRRMMKRFGGERNALVFPFAPPAIIELGMSSGFDFQLQDRGGLGYDALLQARRQLIAMASQNPKLMGVRFNGQENSPQLRITLDREKVGALGLSLADVNALLNTAWGSSYVDDFLDKGRVKKVMVQGDIEFRRLPEDLNQWYFRNFKGAMVPFSSVAHISWEQAPQRLTRYNGLPSMEILGSPAPGYSSGEAMAEMERMAAQLPAGIGFEWTGISFQERASGSQAPMLFALSIIVVFLCLAALYESWSVPFAVVLVVPLGVLGAISSSFVRGFANDIYLQVGLLATIGLSAKNAILIVEFAKDLHDRGRDLLEATAEAARMRLRPILMTSMAFLLGVLPLAVSTGAGSGGQNAIGTAVMGGTASATLLGIFSIPVFFVVVVSLFSIFKKHHDSGSSNHKEPH